MRGEFSHINNQLDDILPVLFRRVLSKAIPLVRNRLEVESPADLVGDLVEMADNEGIIRMQGELARELREIIDELDLAAQGTEEGRVQSSWWWFRKAATEHIGELLGLSFSSGATEAAGLMNRMAYEAGETNKPDLIGFNWQLIDPGTLAEIEDKAAELVTRVNDGTKYFLRQSILAGVKEGLTSPDIADMIKSGATIDEILGSSQFKYVTRYTKEAIEGMSISRLDSIVNTEINRAETDGRLAQWRHMGLTKKRWVHTGPADQCVVCLGNEHKGFIPMDERFDSVWGEQTIDGPPAHPSVCHCHVEFDEGEAIRDIAKLNAPWDGRDAPSYRRMKEGLPRTGPVVTVEDLGALLAAETNRVEWDGIIRGWMKRNRKPTRFKQVTMDLEQKGYTFEYDGVEWVYGRDGLADTAMALSLYEWHRPPFDNEIGLPASWKATTKKVILTRQRNNQDSYWESVGGGAGFKSYASAGDGVITVYNNNALRRDVYYHETAHTYAKAKWGGPTPPEGSEYATLHNQWRWSQMDVDEGKIAVNPREAPVRDYGRLNGAEDFATAVELFAFSNKEAWERAPQRAKIINRLMRDEAYGG